MSVWVAASIEESYRKTVSLNPCWDIKFVSTGYIGVTLDLSTKCKHCEQELPEEQQPKTPAYIKVTLNTKEFERIEKKLQSNAAITERTNVDTNISCNKISTY